MLTDDLSTAGYPTKVVVTLGQSDITAPVITGFLISSQVVVAGPQPTTVYFDVSFTEDLSGVFLLEVLLAGPSGGAQTLAGSGNADNGDVIIGTILNGTIRAGVVFPAFVPSGDWTISRIRLTDHAGNFIALYTQDLANLGYPTKITVTTQLQLQRRSQITSI
jgi:hypothetical protein